MKISKLAKSYYEKIFSNDLSELEKTDPEFMERFINFALDEVTSQDDLEDKTRFMAILATLIRMPRNRCF